MKKTLLFCLLLAATYSLSAQTTITLHPEQATQRIPKEIYGHFSEHLGSCIYGGLWVGPQSTIPNTDGYRNDVLAALKELQIPVLRWPGGCFADYYHWRDGIGPRALRPRMVNSSWGGTVEDNSFGTHEFLNLCELLGCEPYVSANVGSGTVEEMADWVEYMTAPDGPLAQLRQENGREKPWRVKYFGVGNESWGCGGQMTPEFYSDQYRRYAEYSRNYGDNRLFKVGSGASDYDYNWTEVLMQRVGWRMNGLSVHYYTVGDWNNKGSATEFTDDQYYWTLGKCLGIEPVLVKHSQIMDKYDAQKNIALFVDEWGTWWDQEPGSIPGHLYQQNTLRDAMVAALSLNVFHKYTDRIKMANIAQIANVLQAMVLTKEDKMVLTPTYHVFNMYKVHMESLHIPLDIDTPQERPADGRNAAVPMVSATASRTQEGVLYITLANVDLKEGQTVTLHLGVPSYKTVTAHILTAPHASDHNTFENPQTVSVQPFTQYKIKEGVLEVRLPKTAIVSLELK